MLSWIQLLGDVTGSTIFTILGSKDTNFDIFWAIFVDHLKQVQRNGVGLHL